MAKKKKKDDEAIEELLRANESFRRLYDRVVSMNGGRVPSSEEIGRRLEETIARYRAAS
jgi:hypothetical protein